MNKSDLKTLNKIFDRESIIDYKECAKVIKITFKELNDIYSLLKYPLIQTTLIDKKFKI